MENITYNSSFLAHRRVQQTIRSYQNGIQAGEVRPLQGAPVEDKVRMDAKFGGETVYSETVVKSEGCCE